MILRSKTRQNEEQLWRSLQEGDVASFEIIYQNYANSLLAYGLKITTQQEIVNDALQDVFIHIWQKREFLPAVSNIRAYLLKSLRNRVIRILESRNLNEDSTQPNHAVQESFEHQLVLEELADEQLSRVYQSIHHLPTRQREVIHLKYFQNFSTEEIASLLNINYQSVSNLLYKGIQKMRQQLNSHGYLSKTNR